MSEIAIVRIVRCPKCENLLPEVIDYSVYQCGGCGAVLRAKNKGIDLDTFTEKLDEEIEGVSVEENFDRYEKINVSEIFLTVLSDDSVKSTISSSSQTERRSILHNRAENCSSSVMNKEEISDVETGEIADEKFMQAKIARDLRDLKLYNDSESLSRSGRLVDGRNGEKCEMGSVEMAQRMDVEVTINGKEGALNLPFKTRYDYENPSRILNNIVGFNNVGEDREALLIKLDELKDQLSRSGNLIEKGKEKTPLDWVTNRYPDSLIAMNRGSGHFSYPDIQFRRPSFQNLYYEPYQYMQREEIPNNGVFHHRNPLMSHMLRRGRHETHAPYQKPMFYKHKSGPYIENQVPNNLMFCNRQNSGSFSSRDFNHRILDPPLRSHNRHLYTRWSSDVNFEVDDFHLLRPSRVYLTSTRQKCRPFMGGAPFLTCHNCFELLVLPRKVCNIKKMKCGACSTMITFAISEKKIVVSIDIEANVVKVDDPYQTGSGWIGSDSFDFRNDGCMKQKKTTFSSYDYNNLDYDFQSMEETENLNGSRKYSNSADLLIPDNRFVEGNISGRSMHEKDLSNKNTVRKISRKESSETEIDLSSNEYYNTGTTFDSGEGSREGDRLKGSKIVESFFAGIMKKSCNKSNQNVEEKKANVTVNGYPIHDRLVKKAEKLAGQIHPGSYWYDFRAGFWGTTGGPCLGIIPPFIEEFNYPMPENCGGGNTHVYVNGRELNEKDLNLLESRGLPAESNRSYIIEISGRVLDEDTGEELDGLGKLAPTVEKAKRGFGMRDPNAVCSIADSYSRLTHLTRLQILVYLTKMGLVSSSTGRCKFLLTF